MIYCLFAIGYVGTVDSLNEAAFTETTSWKIDMMRNANVTFWFKYENPTDNLCVRINSFGNSNVKNMYVVDLLKLSIHDWHRMELQRVLTDDGFKFNIAIDETTHWELSQETFGSGYADVRATGRVYCTETIQEDDYKPDIRKEKSHNLLMYLSSFLSLSILIHVCCYILLRKNKHCRRCERGSYPIPEKKSHGL